LSWSVILILKWSWYI